MHGLFAEEVLSCNEYAIWPPHFKISFPVEVWFFEGAMIYLPFKKTVATTGLVFF
jgi:hypothetical protein